MKFFLDNNLPPSWAKALTALSLNHGGHTVTHLREKFSPDVTDVHWINALAAEGGWIIVSGDVRITRNRLERETWLQSGLVAFFMGKSWRNHDFWDQTWRIVRWWPIVIQRSLIVALPAGFEIPLNFGKFVSITLK